MTAEEKIRELENAVGALAEMTHIFYESMIRSGFEEPKAFALTIAFMQTAFSNTVNREGDK